MTGAVPSRAVVLDPSALAELRAIDEVAGPGFVAEVVRLFGRDCPSRLAELARALAQCESAGAAAVVHTMKGSCAAVGAGRMALVCEEIEGLLRRRDHDGAADAARRLAAEYDLVKAALVAEVRRGAQGSDSSEAEQAEQA